MDDDERTDPIDPVVEPEADTDPAPEERTYTRAEMQAESDRVAAKVRAEEKKRRRRRTKPQAQPQETATQTNDAEPEEGKTQWQLRDDFDDATEGMRWASTKQKRFARDKFIADKPADPDAWAEEMQEIFGSVTRTDIPTNDNTDEQAPDVPAEPPVSDRGSPASRPDYDTTIDPNTLTEDDIRRMTQKYGKSQANLKIREMAQNWYRGRAIVKKKR